MDRKEIVNSIVKSAFALIPYAGQPLNELFYEYRGRVKQNRLNEFSQMLSDYFISNSNINLEALNLVEFSDLFESVILRVARTDSKEKHKRFKDILTNYIEKPNPSIDHTDTFLELVSVLDEVSIQILKTHFEADDEMKTAEKKRSLVKNEIDLVLQRIEKERLLKDNGGTDALEELELELSKIYNDESSLVEKIYEVTPYKKSDFYNLTDDDFLYLKQILVSKALMTDPAVSSIGHVAFKHLRITLFGKYFINFIRGGEQ